MGLTDLDAYLAALPDDARARLDEVRRVVKALAPNTTEGMSYGMPMFSRGGRPLVYFAAWKSHCALYGVHLDQQQKEGRDTGKGTIRFPLDEPLPEELLKSLIGTRVAEADGEQAKRKRK